MQQIRVSMNLYRPVRKAKAGCGNAASLALEGEIAMARGDRERALKLLEQGDRALIEIDMTMFAMGVRRARGPRFVVH